MNGDNDDATLVSTTRMSSALFAVAPLLRKRKQQQQQPPYRRLLTQEEWLARGSSWRSQKKPRKMESIAEEEDDDDYDDCFHNEDENLSPSNDPSSKRNWNANAKSLLSRGLARSKSHNKSALSLLQSSTKRLLLLPNSNNNNKSGRASTSFTEQQQQQKAVAKVARRRLMPSSSSSSSSHSHAGLSKKQQEEKEEEEKEDEEAERGKEKDDDDHHHHHHHQDQPSLPFAKKSRTKAFGRRSRSHCRHGLVASLQQEQQTSSSLVVRFDVSENQVFGFLHGIVATDNNTTNRHNYLERLFQDQDPSAFSSTAHLAELPHSVKAGTWTASLVKTNNHNNTRGSSIPIHLGIFQDHIKDLDGVRLCLRYDDINNNWGPLQLLDEKKSKKRKLTNSGLDVTELDPSKLLRHHDNDDDSFIGLLALVAMDGFDSTSEQAAQSPGVAVSILSAVNQKQKLQQQQQQQQQMNTTTNNNNIPDLFSVPEYRTTTTSTTTPAPLATATTTASAVNDVGVGMFRAFPCKNTNYTLLLGQQQQEEPEQQDSTLIVAVDVVFRSSGSSAPRYSLGSSSISSCTTTTTTSTAAANNITSSREAVSSSVLLTKDALDAHTKRNNEPPLDMLERMHRQEQQQQQQQPQQQLCGMTTKKKMPNADGTASASGKGVVRRCSISNAPESSSSSSNNTANTDSNRSTDGEPLDKDDENEIDLLEREEEKEEEAMDPSAVTEPSYFHRKQDDEEEDNDGYILFDDDEEDEEQGQDHAPPSSVASPSCPAGNIHVSVRELDEQELAALEADAALSKADDDDIEVAMDTTCSSSSTPLDNNKNNNNHPELSGGNQLQVARPFSDLDQESNTEYFDAAAAAAAVDDVGNENNGSIRLLRDEDADRGLDVTNDEEEEAMITELFHDPTIDANVVSVLAAGNNEHPFVNQQVETAIKDDSTNSFAFQLQNTFFGGQDDNDDDDDDDDDYDDAQRVLDTNDDEDVMQEPTAAGEQYGLFWLANDAADDEQDEIGAGSSNWLQWFVSIVLLSLFLPYMSKVVFELIDEVVIEELEMEEEPAITSSFVIGMELSYWEAFSTFIMSMFRLE